MTKEELTNPLEQLLSKASEQESIKDMELQIQDLIYKIDADCKGNMLNLKMALKNLSDYLIDYMKNPNKGIEVYDDEDHFPIQIHIVEFELCIKHLLNTIVNAIDIDCDEDHDDDDNTSTEPLTSELFDAVENYDSKNSGPISLTNILEHHSSKNSLQNYNYMVNFSEDSAFASSIAENFVTISSINNSTANSKDSTINIYGLLDKHNMLNLFEDNSW